MSMGRVFRTSSYVDNHHTPGNLSANTIDTVLSPLTKKQECDITEEYAEKRLSYLGCLPITTRGDKSMFYLPSETSENPNGEGNGRFSYHEIRANNCGGNLASVLDEDERNLVVSLLPVQHMVWLGGKLIITCTDEAKECWEWTDGSTFEYKDGWAFGQPKKKQDMAHILLQNGKMRGRRFWDEYRAVYLLPLADYKLLQNSTLPVCDNSRTLQPTLVPSGYPSSLPPVSLSPSTTENSESPSPEPSSSTSIEPSRRPSKAPSTYPSFSSFEPSSSPSLEHSHKPSKLSSGYPSVSSLSVNPTFKPSVHPSALPFDDLSNHPSTENVDSLSYEPSSSPSVEPSNSPSNEGVASPYPSEVPSNESTNPSSSNSSSLPPSLVHSVESSQKPSSNFSSVPSSVPTKKALASLKITTTKSTTEFPKYGRILVPVAAALFLVVVGLIGRRFLPKKQHENENTKVPLHILDRIQISDGSEHSGITINYN